MLFIGETREQSIMEKGNCKMMGSTDIEKRILWIFGPHLTTFSPFHAQSMKTKSICQKTLRFFFFSFCLAFT